MNKLNYYLLLIFFFATQFIIAGELKFADALQSNMVIQQAKPFKVWGTGKSNATIIITTDWSKKSVTATTDKMGAFEALIDVPKAKKGDFKTHQIVIASDGETRTISNLLIGDVWFASGQSNMQFRMKELEDSDKEIDQANFPNIRLLTVDFNYAGSPIQNFKGEWLPCSPQSVAEFSAIGYFFAVKLYQELDIPIGIIYSGVGGSVVQAYVPREELEADPLLRNTYLFSFLESIRAQEPIEGVFTWDRLSSPYLLYNAMISPFSNLSIKGFLWYQGESNAKERGTYARATEVMIDAWKRKFAQGNLPFYYVQIAPYPYDNKEPNAADIAFFRETQTAFRQLKNVEMVTTLDVGDATDIHPKDKKPVGLRLAYTALNQTYHKNIEYKGPQFDHFKISGQQVEISFKPNTLSGGLETRDGSAPKHFQIAGEDKTFYEADATIVGNKIIVKSHEVQKPVAVRYAFTNAPTTNLQNGKGLPAEQFRTDEWKENWVQPKLDFVPIIVDEERQ